MNKKPSTLKNMALSLLCVTAISGAGVSGVYLLTYNPIQKAEQEKEQAALKAVLPPFDRTESFQIPDPSSTENWEATKAYLKDSLVGIAINASTQKGFSGEIQCMVGFYPTGKICKVHVLEHAETPGLGSKMTEIGFARQFEEKIPNKDLKMLVKKDGGDIDAITAATISSRAYCDALQKAFDIYFKNRNGGPCE